MIIILKITININKYIRNAINIFLKFDYPVIIHYLQLITLQLISIKHKCRKQTVRYEKKIYHLYVILKNKLQNYFNMDDN